MSVSISFSNLSANGHSDALTRRILPGEQILLASEDMTAIKSFLQVLAGEKDAATGTAWMRWLPDSTRPFRFEETERGRLPRVWKQHTASVWATGTGYESRVQACVARSPNLLLLEGPLTDTPSFSALLPVLLQQRKSTRTVTVVADPLMRQMDRYDYIGLLVNGKWGTWETPQQLAARFNGNIWTVRVADMERLQKDLPEWYELKHFYRAGDTFRVITKGQNATDHAANAGISVMRMTAWLALKDHQAIEVQPAQPVLKDLVSFLS